jgi:hypothetical protein
MNLLKPELNLNDKLVYSTTLLISKKSVDTVQAIKDVINDVFIQEKNKKFKGYDKDQIFIGLQDGDAYYEMKPEKRESYRGHWYMNVSRQPRFGAPVVLGTDDERITELNSGDFTSGDYGVARIEIFPFDNKGKVGISASIVGAKKTRTGERFGGGESSETTLAALGKVEVKSDDSLDELF